MNRCLQNLLQTLKEENNTDVELSKSTPQILKNLGYLEKELLADEFSRWNWNIGSAKILKWFQEARVLSTTEYIAYKYEEDTECVQLILNDLLECEFILLADLCRHFDCRNETSGKIIEFLTDAFRLLCKDLCDNPSLLQVNYLSSLASFLLVDQLNDVKKLHVKIFLEYSHQNSIEEALQYRHVWNKDDDLSNPALGDLFRTVVNDNELVHLVDILKTSQSDNFKCWRFYLLFLKHVCQPNAPECVLNDLKLAAKGYVKTMFKNYIDNKTDQMFYVLMLTARQICSFNEAILGSYASWYKATIGEMKYTLKADKFNLTMQTLINMLEYESDPEILKVHINTSIPAPPYCNEIVLNYKQMCRSRLFYCTTEIDKSVSDKQDGSKCAEAMEVYIIDDE